MLSEKATDSPDEFFYQCLTSDTSFESVRECDLSTFYHRVRFELRFTHSNVSLEGPKIICDISPSSRAPKPMAT